MTFVDVVFPAFLFIVGMSITFALNKRIESGQSLMAVEGQIVLRSLGLLLIGFFMVNQESLGEDGYLPKPVWILLVYLGILLLWNRSSPASSRWHKYDLARRSAGAMLLTAMAIMYRGNGDRDWFEMRPQWWGIIGLIGWANLVASNVYLVARNRVGGLIGAMALLACLCFACKHGFLPDWWIFQFVDVASALASLPSIVVAGMVAGVVLSPKSSVQLPSHRIRWGLVYGAGMAIGAHLLHSLHDVDSMFFINKISSTIPWALWCSAITIWAWCFVYVIVDVKGWRWLTSLFATAGENSLFAYILVPILYAAFDLYELATGNTVFYWALEKQMITGITRSLVLACVVVVVSGLLRRLGIQPKL
jgi:hypothetical protein